MANTKVSALSTIVPVPTDLFYLVDVPGVSQGKATLQAVANAMAPIIAAATLVTISSATAFAVGPNGATNPTLNVVTNVASAATGLNITGNAAGSGVTLTALSSGATENIILVPKGAGGIGIGAADNLLFRDAASILAHRNGTTSQRFKNYTTFTNASNGRWVELIGDYSGGQPAVWATGNGTGATPNLFVAATGNVLIAPGDGGGVLSASTSVVLVNPLSVDVDFRHSSDTNANHFWSDAGAFAGVGAFGFGVAASTAAYIIVNPTAFTTTAATSTYKLQIAGTSTITASGTVPVFAAVEIDATTLSGTVTEASSFRIAGPPTGGGTNYAEHIVTGAVRWGNYGAGAATFDANGNITSVSDERAKDIQGSFNAGMAELRKIAPILYKWKAGQNMETEHTYAGFGAGNVHSAIPYATGQAPNGYRSLQDRALLAALVNAVKELDTRLGGIEQHA